MRVSIQLKLLFLLNLGIRKTVLETTLKIFFKNLKISLANTLNERIIKHMEALMPTSEPAELVTERVNQNEKSK